MRSLPPRERVALGVGSVTAGFLLQLLLPLPIAAFAGGLLIRVGVAVAVFALLRLYLQARNS